MPEHKPVSHPWRRFLRFSVRGLIVLVIAIGGGLGWLVRSARIQREAVATICDAGGSVLYDWEWSDGDYTKRREPWAPGWLVELIGVDYFGHVTDVLLTEITDTAMVPVGRLTGLQSLRHAYESPLTDAGMAHLKGLTSLQHLDLGGTQIGDAGLVHLKGLYDLSELDLGFTQVTDAGLARLRG